MTPLLLEIFHETHFHYSGPVRESVMEVWMQPRSTQTQRLVGYELETTPRAKFFVYADWLGNSVYHFDVPGSHTDLTVRATSTVETRPPEALPASLSHEEWDRLHGSWVTDKYWDFLRPSRFVEDSSHLEKFLEERAIERAFDPLTALRALNTAIYGAFEYTPGFTAADSPIDAALAHRRGVCQDFAHIMLAVCRHWGIPARYVSGYLFHGINDKERSTPDATHAWVECFLPSLGWIGFDPTNDVIAAERHVSVAVGRDYADCPPTRGVYKGDVSAALDVAVLVRPARHAAANPDFMRLVRPPRSPTALFTKKPATTAASVAAQQQQQQQQ
jgi:transglutaminase-like putative cysteine protease